MSNVITSAGWKVHWKLSESAGVMIYLADFRGARVLWQGSLPYVTIDHQKQDLEAEVVEDDSDETEPSGGHGPFWIPLGPRTLVDDVRVSELRNGFEIVADFVAGPYRYTQMWRFHDDGRLEPWLTIHGGGVHSAHTYHPHWRFDFDINGASNDAVERFEGERWTRVAEEGWFPFAGEHDADGNVWRQVDFSTGAAVTIRPHGREDAELFAIRYREGEWTPASPRNDAGSQPYPAAYVGSDSLDGEDVILWYVSHVHYDESFPFTAGPWIRVQEA
ncbi:hypothetical protein [Haliangium ochraceum]|uniref:Uncharacterized protein n=1 Tax=Haliangium ochraceum (strain DSM 14365 / JCM 11303 / SMP-2) TaxID=502025 RepID=D0LUH2_HALO1|nr:hypothetical protein [Haliangium ochraceum]ACY19295.1 hypothetical protein Hoch_6831 [Haliangium ochraceum DSM 14365]